MKVFFLLFVELSAVNSMFAWEIIPYLVLSVWCVLGKTVCDYIKLKRKQFSRIQTYGGAKL